MDPFPKNNSSSYQVNKKTSKICDGSKGKTAFELLDVRVFGDSSYGGSHHCIISNEYKITNVKDLILFHTCHT